MCLLSRPHHFVALDAHYCRVVHPARHRRGDRGRIPSVRRDAQRLLCEKSGDSVLRTQLPHEGYALPHDFLCLCRIFLGRDRTEHLLRIHTERILTTAVARDIARDVKQKRCWTTDTDFTLIEECFYLKGGAHVLSDVDVSVLTPNGSVARGPCGQMW